MVNEMEMIKHSKLSECYALFSHCVVDAAVCENDEITDEHIESM